MQASGFRKKHSITFIPSSGGQAEPFDFRSRYGSGTLAASWQVRRADFDEMLLRNAARKGAEVREQCTVTGLIRNAHGVVTGVRAETRDGTVEEISAPITIDATGKEAFRRCLTEKAGNWLEIGDKAEGGKYVYTVHPQPPALLCPPLPAAADF